MTTPNPWNHANATVSDAPTPLLADVLGLDGEDIADVLNCTEDATIVVLAELLWDISGVEAVPSPWDSESGEVYLAAGGSRYWFIQSELGNHEVDSVVAASDVDAVSRFLEGFVDGNDDNATIYLRPEPDCTSPHGADSTLEPSDGESAES